MKPFEIFRPGTHTASNGSTLSFSDEDVSAIAASYDPSIHEAPIVVGHPKTDAPAYGWVEGLSQKNGRLVATPGKLDTAFSDLVAKGRFRKVSAAFFSPNSPNNPTPGVYALRHVGFLGAQPPAVKGLKPVEFADDADLVVDIEFAEAHGVLNRASWALDAAQRLFRGLRDRMIETESVEKADEAMPEWEIEQIGRAAAELRAEADAGMQPGFAEPDPTATPQIKHVKEPVMADPKDKADLDERQKSLDKREAEFAERQAQERAQADTAFVDALVKEGRLPVGLQPVASALFAGLADQAIEFAEGDETVSKTPRAALKSLLKALPLPVVTDELAKGGEVNFEDSGEVASAIQTIQAEAAKAGQVLSAADAASRLKR